MKLAAPLAALAVALLCACGGTQTALPTATTPSAQAPPPAPNPYTGAARVGPIVSAHRGGAAYAPENTMAAYRNAARMGVDDFETDTTLTRDGVLVLIHDDTLDRTTDCTGPVNSKTFAQIQGCDAGYWWTPGQSTTSHDEGGAHPHRGKGVTVPAAQELFALAASLGERGPTVTIEIKNIPGEAGFDALCGAAVNLVNLIHGSGIVPRITVQSFYPPCIDRVKQLDASIRTLHLSFGSCVEAVLYNAGRGHEIASPTFGAPDMNAQCVTLAHSLGQQVVPWTVDRRSDIEAVAAMGVDGIITNYPMCMFDVFGRQLPAAVTPPGIALEQPAPLCAAE